MIDGEIARVTAFESEYKPLLTIYNFGKATFEQGLWKSKITLEFEGEIPEWVRKACKENMGRVRILP
jgi:hypothetical protein